MFLHMKALQLRTQSRETSGLLPLKASSGEVESFAQIGEVLGEALCSRAQRWPAMCSLPLLLPRTSNVCQVDCKMKALNAYPICDLSCGPWMDSS